MSRATHLENMAFIVGLLVLLFTPLMPAEVAVVAIGLVLCGVAAMVALRRTRAVRRPPG